MKRILDHNGKPFVRSNAALVAEVNNLRHKILRGSYDAAQTVTENELHWSRADNLDPHAANSLAVRKKLRTRSRYEVIENNPYLKGTVLSVVGDFVGGGPKLQITDKRLSPERRQFIESLYEAWFKAIKFRQMLWRMRLAKIVDGETFAFAFNNERLRGPVKLDFDIVETDRVSSAGLLPLQSAPQNEVDGVRFDQYNNPTEYHLLKAHPGSQLSFAFLEGDWIKAEWVLHWFRQDRGWVRGIPELTPSIPLCALLRRYTLAVVLAAEDAANHSSVLETEGSMNPTLNTGGEDGNEGEFDNEPFDVIPHVRNMMVTLPAGHKMHQLKSENPSAMFDRFVDMLLREIIRPLNTPFNIAAGSSADSNMASAIVDAHLYRGGIKLERMHGEEEVVEPAAELFWRMAAVTPRFLNKIIKGDDGAFLQQYPSMFIQMPAHYWRWDRVGLDHTDPVKVAKARQIEMETGVMLDRDYQEIINGRNYEDWLEAFTEERGNREAIGAPIRSAELIPREPDDED